jgi:hypothetical protein
MVKGVSAPIRDSGLYSHTGTAKFGDVAYIPASGPAGKSCDDCVAMRHSRGAKVYGRCLKAAELRRLQLDEIGYIDRATPACKFFAIRPEGMKPWPKREKKNANPSDMGGTDEPTAADQPAT